MPDPHPAPHAAPGGHMPDAQFRALGHTLIDYIADYTNTVEQYPVLSPTAYGDTLAKLPAHAPREPEPLTPDALLADIQRLIIPGITHWQHPSFFAFFPANASGPAILGELLAAGLGVQGMLWATSPACTEFEVRMLDWMGELLGLPADFLSTNPNGGGVIQGTASEAALAALVAARRVTLQSVAAATREARPDPRRLTVYTSKQSHSSIVKAAMVAGLAHSADDRAQVRLIDTDANLALSPAALEAALKADLAQGFWPTFIAATIGTTSTTAIDPLGPIADAVDRAWAHAPRGLPKPWLHVDAAHAGAMLVCPEFRHIAMGLDRADSFCFNPHKWLLTNFDCDCFWTRRRRDLTDAMSITPEYLRNQAADAQPVTDFRDWHVPLGRRFRSLKLWLVLRHYGQSGLQAYIREHIRLTALLESLLAADARFEITHPRTMNLICLRLAPRAGESPEATDNRTRGLLRAVNASGKAYLTHTVVPLAQRNGSPADQRPTYVIRVCIGGTLTQESHVRALAHQLSELA